MFLKFILFVLIFYVPEQAHFPQSLGIRGINVFNVLFFVALAAAMSQPKLSEEASPLKGRVLFYFFIMGFALLVSLFKSPHFVQDIILYKTLIFYAALYFLFFRAVQDIKTLRFMFVAVAFTYGMMSLEIIREAAFFGFAPKIRLVGAFGLETGNPNYAGAYFAVLAPVAAAFMMYYKEDSRVKLVATALFFMGLMAAFFTYSRQAYMAIAATTFFLAISRSVMAAIFVGILVINYAAWAPDSVVSRVETTAEVDESTGEEKLEESADSRFVIWTGAWELIKSNPIGIGFNQFKHRIDPYLPDWVKARDAHSSFFLIWTEAGYIGLIAFLSLLIGFFSIGRRLYRAGLETDNLEAEILGLGFSISALAVAMSNVTSSTFQSGEVMANYWIMAALVSRYAILIEEGYRLPSKESEEEAPIYKQVAFGQHRQYDDKETGSGAVNRFEDRV